MKLPRKEIYVDGKLYLTRWYLFTVPFLGWRVVLHRFTLPDRDPRLHTHPWKWSFSLVLWGAYEEQRAIGFDAHRGIVRGVRTVRWFNWITATTLHRIAGLHRPKVWTLFVMGPKVQKWGMVTTQSRSDGHSPTLLALIPYDSEADSERKEVRAEHRGNCPLWKEKATMAPRMELRTRQERW